MRCIVLLRVGWWVETGGEKNAKKMLAADWLTKKPARQNNRRLHTAPTYPSLTIYPARDPREGSHLRFKTPASAIFSSAPKVGWFICGCVVVRKISLCRACAHERACACAPSYIRVDEVRNNDRLGSNLHDEQGSVVRSGCITAQNTRRQKGRVRYLRAEGPVKERRD